MSTRLQITIYKILPGKPTINQENSDKCETLKIRWRSCEESSCSCEVTQASKTWFQSCKMFLVDFKLSHMEFQLFFSFEIRIRIRNSLLISLLYWSAAVAQILKSRNKKPWDEV